MLQALPVQAVLLPLFGLMAWPAMRYVLRYGAASPGRWSSRDRPSFPGAPTTSGFTLSIVVLIALIGLSIYIFTPVAQSFVRAPRFLPVLLLFSALFGLYECVRGLVTGQVEPMAHTAAFSFSRETEPRRYWLSTLWNALITGGFLFLALKL